eukprot:3465224-Rhodomonas_salina.5
MVLMQVVEREEAQRKNEEGVKIQGKPLQNAVDLGKAGEKIAPPPQTKTPRRPHIPNVSGEGLWEGFVRRTVGMRAEYPVLEPYKVLPIILRMAYAMSGTGLGIPDTWCPAVLLLVLRYSILLPVLRGYAATGTDVGYAATRRGHVTAVFR